MILKVCGMRNADNIQQLSQIESVDWMGFIFTDKSKRYALDQANFDTRTYKKKVGVFIDASIEDILHKTKKYKLDIIQLHGFESPDFCYQLREESVATVSLMKAFRVDSAFDFDMTKPYEGIVDYFLFDAKGDNAGGNGIQFDWSVMDRYNGDTPFLLAGGINPHSIDKIRSFDHPRWIGIDVNSGFESEPGLKNIDQLIDFLQSLNKRIAND